MVAVIATGTTSTYRKPLLTPLCSTRASPPTGTQAIRSPLLRRPPQTLWDGLPASTSMSAIPVPTASAAPTWLGTIAGLHRTARHDLLLSLIHTLLVLTLYPLVFALTSPQPFSLSTPTSTPLPLSLLLLLSLAYYAVDSLDILVRPCTHSDDPLHPVHLEPALMRLSTVWWCGCGVAV